MAATNPVFAWPEQIDFSVFHDRDRISHGMQTHLDDHHRQLFMEGYLEYGTLVDCALSVFCMLDNARYIDLPGMNLVGLLNSTGGGREKTGRIVSEIIRDQLLEVQQFICLAYCLREEKDLWRTMNSLRDSPLRIVLKRPSIQGSLHNPVLVDIAPHHRPVAANLRDLPTETHQLILSFFLEHRTIAEEDVTDDGLWTMPTSGGYHKSEMCKLLLREDPEDYRNRHAENRPLYGYCHFGMRQEEEPMGEDDGEFEV